eukprot:260834_1
MGCLASTNEEATSLLSKQSQEIKALKARNEYLQQTLSQQKETANKTVQEMMEIIENNNKENESIPMKTAKTDIYDEKEGLEGIMQKKDRTIDLKWNTNPYEHGENLIFIKEDKTVKMVADLRGPKVTVISNTIFTKQTCNMFKIKYRLGIMPGGHSLHLGYITSIDDIKNWEHGLGLRANQETSLGLMFWGDSIHAYGKGFIGSQFNRLFGTQYGNKGPLWKSGDIIEMEFKFNSNMKISVNGTQVTQISLGGAQTIIPAASLGFKYDEIEILDCIVR